MNGLLFYGNNSRVSAAPALSSRHLVLVDLFPKTFCLENTTIHQKFWNEDEVNFQELGKGRRKN